MDIKTDETPKESSSISKNDYTPNGKKRHRRTADEIQRHYRCSVPDCNKSYGSEGSLNQHMKIKHSVQTICNEKKSVDKMNHLLADMSSES